MKTIGVTGGIASGKSAVTDLLLERWPVIDADLVAREVVEPGAAGLVAVTESFGPGILHDNGSLNRAALRNMIAHSKEAQERLNGIMHPLIVGTILDRVRACAAHGEAFCFVSAALMIETGSYQNYDDIILVSAPEELRLKRLLARDGMDESSARKLMGRQWSDEKKRLHATCEIVNDGTLEVLHEKVWDALRGLGVEV